MGAKSGWTRTATRGSYRRLCAGLRPEAAAGPARLPPVAAALWLALEGSSRLGTLSLLVEGDERDLEQGELVRVAPDVRRQLVNRGPGRLLLLAIGGAEPHHGRDGIAHESLSDRAGRPPQEVPLPDDLPPHELRANASAAHPGP